MPGKRPHLSVVVPVYNERATIHEILRQISAVPVGKEIILVDDASTGGTRAELEDYVAKRAGGTVRLFLQTKNRGKGAAIRRGFADRGLGVRGFRTNAVRPTRRPNCA